MGAWGYNSLENDGGLDELALLFEKSSLVEHVRESLQQDLHECSDEIRSTANLVYVLAKHGMWQHDSLREVASLAISQLRDMLDKEVYTNVNFLGEIRHLINQLREIEPKPSCGLERPPNVPSELEPCCRRCGEEAAEASSNFSVQ